MPDLKFGSVLLIIIILVKGVLVAGLRTRMCSVSLDTVELARRCPLKRVDWEERESVWKCNEIIQNCSSPSEFRYHCVRDSSGKLIEVCAPSTFLKGKKCPEFNYGGERIQEDYTYTGSCRRCPFSYSSNVVFYYKECLKSSDGTTSNSNIQSSFGTSTTLNSNTQTEDDEANRTWIIVVCTTSVVVIIVILGLVIIKYMWSHEHKKDMLNGKEKIEEKEAKGVTKGHLELQVKEQEKDDEIENLIIKSKEVFKAKEEKHQLIKQGVEGEKIATHPSIYYKGKFAKTKGGEEGGH